VFGYPQHVLRVCAHRALAWQVKEWEAEFKLLRLELLGKELQSRVETASELKGTKEGSLIQQEMRKLIESLVEIQPCWVWAMERCSWHLRQSIGAPREAIDLCQSVLKRLLEEERPVDDKMLIAVPGVMMDKEEEFGHQKLMNVEKAEDRKYLHERMEFQLVHAQVADASASSAIITPQLRAQFDRLQRSTQARKERLVQLYQQKKSGVAGAAADGLGKDDEALKLKRQLIQQEVARAKARELCSQQRRTEGMEQMSDERSIMIRQQQQQMMTQPGQMTSVQERMNRRLAKRKDEEKQSLGPEACGDIKASEYVSQLSSEDLGASLRVECDKLWNQVLQAHSRLQQEQQSGIEYVHHIVAHTLNHPEARWLGRWYLGETFPFAHESQFLTIVSTLLWRTLVQATKNRIVKKWEEDPDLKALPWSRGDKESEKREAMNEYLLHNRQDHQSGLDMTEEIVSLLGDNKDLEAGRPFEEVVEHCADLGKLHRVCMNVFEKRVRRAIDSIQETMEQRVPFIRELEQNAGAGFQLEHQLNVSTNFPPGNALEREREGERERFRPNEKMEFVFWFLKDRITFDNDLQWVLMQQVAQDLEQHFKDNPSHTQNDLQGHEHAVLSREVGYVHAIKERMLDLAPHYEVYGSQDTQEMLTLIMKNGEESKDFQDHTSAHGLFVDQPGSMCDEDITNGAHEHQGGNDIPAEGREPRIFSVHGKGFDMVVNHHESLETRRRHQFYEKMDQFIERATTWAAQVKIFSQLDALYREAFWLRSKLVCLLQSAGGGGVLEEQYGEWLQHLVYFMEESADLAEKTREAHTLHSRILVRRILCALWNKQHEERRYMDDDCRPEHKVEDTTHYVSQLARQIDVHQTKLMQLRDGLMQVAQQVSASAAQGGDAGMHPEEVADMALLGMFLAGATNSNNASKCADTGQNLQKIDAKFEDMRRLIDNIHEEAQNFKGLKEELRLVTGPADQCVGQYHEVVRDIAICMIREEMLNKAKEVEMERKKREQEEQAQRAQEDLLKNEEESEAIRRREEEKKAKKKAKEREKKEKERLEKERLREEEEAREREEEERERKNLEEQQRKEQEKREAEMKRKREEEEKIEEERPAQLNEQEQAKQQQQQQQQKPKQQPRQQSQQQQSITATTKSKPPKQQPLLQVEQPQPQQHQQAASMQHQACPAVSAGTGVAAATDAVDIEKTQPATTDAPPTPEHSVSEGKEAVAAARPATRNNARNAGVKATSSNNQARVGAKERQGQPVEQEMQQAKQQQQAEQQEQQEQTPKQRPVQQSQQQQSAAMAVSTKSKYPKPQHQQVEQPRHQRGQVEQPRHQGGQVESAQRTKDPNLSRRNEGEGRPEEGGGGGGDEGSLAGAPPHSSVRAGFEPVECATGGPLRATTEAEQMFLSRFNPNPPRVASCESSSPVTAATAAATAVSARVSEASADASGAPTAPAAVMHARARESPAARFKFADLLAATGNFERKLGCGGSGSVFRGTLKSSATQIAVKKLELAAGSELRVALVHMQTEVQALSQVHHPNIVPLLGWSDDGDAPCLVYALMVGGSLEDRLSCKHGAEPLKSIERILVLSDVARGLAYLHSVVKTIHLDVKSANILIDTGCVGRIGDFGIARSTKDHQGVTATQLQTEVPMGTTIYMSPEYKNGELSYKVDSFAFGLVIVEALTGLPVLHPAAGRSNLHTMFEEDMDTAEELHKHLDTRAYWEPHTSERIPLLYSIAARCLEPRPKRRPEVVDLIPEFEKVRCDTQALDTKEEREQSPGTRCPMGNSEVPDAFCCPIGLDIMSDPVFLIETGHTFERRLIEAHLQRSDRGPLCGVQLKSKTLMPNYALRQAIEAYLSDRGQAPGRFAPPPPSAPSAPSPPSAAAVAGQ
jgi:serine/threonine protein kinase